MNIAEDLLVYKYDDVQKSREWCKKIPSIHFEKEWDVKIIPPFGGAIIRFTIDFNDKHVSVYLDGYSRLGYVVDANENPIPYWEAYCGEECYRYWLNEQEQMIADIKKYFEESEDKQNE